MPMIKIGGANYIPSEKVLGARIFEKDGKIKVAFAIDAIAKENQVAFSDECKDAKEAETLVLQFSSQS